MKDLVSEDNLNVFIQKIHQVFPNLVAGVIADKHGLPIASKIHPQLNTNEQMLSLEAVAEGRRIVNVEPYQKVVRRLSENVNLMMLLQKSHQNLHRFKELNRILERDNPI